MHIIKDTKKHQNKTHSHAGTSLAQWLRLTGSSIVLTNKKAHYGLLRHLAADTNITEMY